MRTNHFSSFVALVTLASAAAWSGCSSDPASRKGVDGGSGTGGGTNGAGGVTIGTGGGSSIITGDAWPKDPVFDDGVTPDAADKFTAAPAGTGPCISEPQDGAMMPRNWLRPRFRFAPAAGQDLFQITLSSASMENPLVIYTKNPAYTMAANFWGGIGQKATGTPVTVDVTIRATAATGGAVSESKAAFIIAPVDAGGSMVYWANTSAQELPDTSKLVGFSVDDWTRGAEGEGTVEALTIPQVQETGLTIETGAPKPDRGGSGAGKTSCIGCHTSTPDGGSVFFNDGWPWSGVSASVEEGTVGQRPSYVSATAATMLRAPFIGTFTFTKAHWADGDRRLVTTITKDSNAEWPWTWGAVRNLVTASDLFWMNLEAEGTLSISTAVDVTNDQFAALEGTGWGRIARTGDSRAVANPNWSNDGKTIVYASVEQVAGGHPGGLDPANTTAPDKPKATPTESDIYSVPYNGGDGGEAKPVAGAAEPGKAEYYPDLSADDAFIAYTRTSNTDGYLFYRPDGEIYVVPAAGGTATRLAANDPPACGGEVSPGVLNSWPKWSPGVATGGDGKKYYWLIFSSARDYPEQIELSPDTWTPTATDKRASQLYLAGIAVDAAGNVESFPGVYIWTQTKDTSNLTPAWDEFKIPDVIVK